jgi:hypothetical protein
VRGMVYNSLDLYGWTRRTVKTPVWTRPMVGRFAKTACFLEGWRPEKQLCA